MSQLEPPPPLLAAEEIQRRVAQLGEAISADYGTTPLVLVAVLKGSLFFLADLARHITCPTRLEFVYVSTYGESTRQSRQPELRFASSLKLKGSHVLLVEDIVDTGHTIQYLRRLLLAESPESLRICTLLDKPARREEHVTLDYVGFLIADRFVVGYGLDLAEAYRNLPYIGVVE